MKKLLIAFLLLLSCASFAHAVGLNLRLMQFITHAGSFSWLITSDGEAFRTSDGRHFKVKE